MLLGVDVGGTFTDTVLMAVDGRLITAKAPTTPDDQSLGVMAAIAAALERAQGQTTDIEAFAHGMTVATNALLEGRGARCTTRPGRRPGGSGPPGVVEDLAALDVARARVDEQCCAMAEHDTDVLVVERVSADEDAIADLRPGRHRGIVATC